MRAFDSPKTDVLGSGDGGGSSDDGEGSCGVQISYKIVL
jgi:hypothetical protein